MFLNPTAKPAPRCTPWPCVVLPAPPGQADRVARELLGRRRLERGRPADHLGGRERALDHLAGRQRVARRERVQQPELDGVDPERGGELVHLRLAGEARLHGAEAAHRAARRVVRVDAGRLDQRVRHVVRPAGERGRVRRDRGRATRRRRRRRAGSASARRRAGPRGSRGARPRSSRGAGGRGRRTTRRARRRASPGGSCAARASRRGSASRGPRARRTRRRRRRGGSAPARAARPRQGATWSRSTCSHCVAT